MDWGIGMDRSTMIPGTIHIMLDIVSTYRGIERHSVMSGFRYIRSITSKHYALYISSVALYIYTLSTCVKRYGSFNPSTFSTSINSVRAEIQVLLSRDSRASPGYHRFFSISLCFIQIIYEPRRLDVFQ